MCISTFMCKVKIDWYKEETGGTNYIYIYIYKLDNKVNNK